MTSETTLGVTVRRILPSAGALLLAAGVLAGTGAASARPAGAAAEAGVISTVAGGPGSGLATSVGQNPRYVRVDGNTVLVSDVAHQVLRRIDLATGLESVVAGVGGAVTPATPGPPPMVTPDDGGPAGSAGLDRVGALTVAPDGTIYLADGRRIRRIATDGTITTAVGTGGYRNATEEPEVPLGDARLTSVTSLALDAAGRLWFAETATATEGATIRRLDPDGFVRLVIGGGTTRENGAAGRDYILHAVRGMFFDEAGTLVLADAGRYDTDITRFTHDAVERGQFIAMQVADMTPARNGDLLITDGDRIARLRPDGSLAFQEGSRRGLGSYASVGELPDGRLIAARLNGFYVTAFDRNNTELTLAGDGSSGAAGDGGPATMSQLGRPGSISRATDGSLLIADQTANRVRALTPDGRLTTVLGDGRPIKSEDGTPAALATVRAPSVVEAAPDGSFFVVAVNESNQQLIHKVSRTGMVSTYAGDPDPANVRGDARDENVGTATDLEAGPDGELYIAGECHVARMEPGPTTGHGGATTVVAGITRSYNRDDCGYDGDGRPATESRFGTRLALALSPKGDLYISDANEHRVRRIDRSGVVRAFVGGGVEPFPERQTGLGDGGPATLAHLNRPAGLAVDASGSVLIADRSNYRVRRVTPDGIIDTIAGGSELGPYGDGGNPLRASLSDPYDIEVQGSDRVQIAEADATYTLNRHHRIREVTLPPRQAEPTPAPSPSPAAGPTGPPPPSASAAASPSASPESPAPTLESSPSTSPATTSPEPSPDTTPSSAPAIEPLAPARVLDTRDGTGRPPGRLRDGQTVTFTVAGRGGVPASGVRAVVLNATATGGTASGHLTLFPGGQQAPEASSLNFRTGQSVPNLVVVPLGPGGTVGMRASAGSPHVVADVVGYLPASSSEVEPLAPSRLLDSRSGAGGIDGRLSPGVTYSFTPLGRSGVPSRGVRAVLLNTTVTGPSTSGHLTVYPSGQTPPLASNLNYSSGLTVANLVLVPVGKDGRVSLRANAGSPYAIADVVGYVADTEDPSVHPLAPQRVLDTRDGTGGLDGRLAPGRPESLTVAGRGGVPSRGVRAVFLNVTATGANASGYVTVFPAGQGPPTASNLNFRAGQTVPNLVLVPLDDRGRLALVANAGSPHVLADVVGYVSQ